MRGESLARNAPRPSYMTVCTAIPLSSGRNTRPGFLRSALVLHIFTSLTARSEEEIARKMVGRRHVHLVITAAVGVVNKPADHRGIHAFGVYWTTSISTARVPNKHVRRSIRSMKVPSSPLCPFTRQQAFSTSQTPPCQSPCTASRTSTRYRGEGWPGYNESQSTVSLCTTTRSEVLTCRTLLYAPCRAA